MLCMLSHDVFMLSMTSYMVLHSMRDSAHLEISCGVDQGKPEGMEQLLPGTALPPFCFLSSLQVRSQQPLGKNHAHKLPSGKMHPPCIWAAWGALTHTVLCCPVPLLRYWGRLTVLLCLAGSCFVLTIRLYTIDWC